MKIHKILDMSTEEYNQLRVDFYLKWVSNRSKSNLDLQQRLQNKSLQNYFKHHLNLLETQFKNEVYSYIDQDPKFIFNYYLMITDKLFNNYPSALFNAITNKCTHYDNYAN